MSEITNRFMTKAADICDKYGMSTSAVEDVAAALLAEAQRSEKLIRLYQEEIGKFMDERMDGQKLRRERFVEVAFSGFCSDSRHLWSLMGGDPKDSDFKDMPRRVAQLAILYGDTMIAELDRAKTGF